MKMVTGLGQPGREPVRLTTVRIDRHLFRNCTRGLLFALFALFVLVSAGCSETQPQITAQDRVEQTRVQLVADGMAVPVVDCVIRLAEYDLRSGPLDPVVQDELVMNCERAEAMLNPPPADALDSTLAFVDGPNALGDDADLDRLWLACEAGSGQDCDELFDRSPVGSEYEQFAVSCGNRDEILDCAELDQTEQDKPSE